MAIERNVHSDRRRRNLSLSAAIFVAAGIATLPASADEAGTLRETLTYLHDTYGLNPAQVAEVVTGGTLPGRLARWQPPHLNVAILGTNGVPSALLEDMADTLRTEAGGAQIAANICMENFSVSSAQRLRPAQNSSDCLAPTPDVLIVFDATLKKSGAVIQGIRQAWAPANEIPDGFWEEAAAKLRGHSQSNSACTVRMDAKPGDARVRSAIAYLWIGNTSQVSLDKLGECMDVSQHIVLGVPPIVTEGHSVLEPRLLQILYSPMLSAGMSRSDVAQALEDIAAP